MACRLGGDIQARHDWIKDTLSAIISSSGVSTQLEVPVTNCGPISSAADEVIRRYGITASGDLRPLAVDVSVTHSTPLSQSTLMTNVRSSGSAARNREAKKVRDYGNVSRRLGMHFVPFVMESYGTFGPQAELFLKTLARHITSSRCYSGNANPSVSAALLHSWRRRLSCAMQKANARILQLRALRGTEAHGRQPRVLRPDFSGLQMPRLRY